MQQDKNQCQATVFGDFSVIQPNAETVRYFMESFSDLKMIPSVLETPETRQTRAITFRIGPDIRFLFRSDDSRWTVSFQNERIDVLATKLAPDHPDLPGSEAFRDQALTLFKAVVDRFPIKFSRLSYVAKHFLLNATPEELRSVFTSRFGATTFYTDYPPRHWSLRVNSRKATIFTSDEELNVITQMGTRSVETRIDSEVSTLDGVDCTFDINTAEELTEARFTLTDYAGFLSEAAALEADLRAQMLS